MSTIVEQVREGLEAKIEGIKSALNFVRDPREVERLSKDLQGALGALAKLNERDTRSTEELEKIANMINDGVVEAPENPWSKMKPIEKFKYQVELYCGKLDDAFEQASAQYNNLRSVCDFLKTVDFKKHPYMEGIYLQFCNSLRELHYSIGCIEKQKAIRNSAIAVIDESFEALDILNRFMNNPMALPHINDERDAELEALRNGK